MLFSLFALYLTLQVLFSVFTSQIDECAEKWEEAKRKRVEAGKKGGAPKGIQPEYGQKGEKIIIMQYHIILSADTASEVRQLLSQKRR